MGQKNELAIAVKTQARIIREQADELEELRDIRDSYRREREKTRDLEEVLQAWGIEDSLTPRYGGQTFATSVGFIVNTDPDPARLRWVRSRWKMTLSSATVKDFADQLVPPVAIATEGGFVPVSASDDQTREAVAAGALAHSWREAAPPSCRVCGQSRSTASEYCPGSIL